MRGATSFLLAIASVAACAVSSSALLNNDNTDESTIQTTEAQSRPFAVVSYLPEWRLAGVDWRFVTLHSSHVILFSLEVGGWHPNLKTGTNRKQAKHVKNIWGAKGKAQERSDWQLGALDRLPKPAHLAEAVAAAKANRCRLLLGFGGNGRSAGFAEMTTDPAARRAFVQVAMAKVVELGLDGIDINWEYPGYDFARGYMNDDAVAREYEGLASLIKELRRAFDDRSPATPSRFAVTLAYYPDGRQERLLLSTGAAEAADLLHIMSYDQSGEHSTMDFARRAAEQGRAILPAHKLTLGLPFYGRRVHGGDWVSYEDLVQQHAPLDAAIDLADGIFFNGRDTIAAKTTLAASLGLGGVMIWEVGQDCRVTEVTRDDVTHVATCPDGRSSSLLASISDSMSASNVVRDQVDRVAAEASYVASGDAAAAESPRRSDEL